ncbi:MAG: substrate-binding domain-containing protein [Salegentibacter sp.]
MKTIRIGGVPEHFNLPWHLCMEEGDFEKKDVNVIWKDFPDGTGAMNKALRSGEIDAAVILTEGVTKDILAGNEARIVQVFVGSPLVWGIHVAAESEYKSIQDLEGTTAAISREGSGSQLMAYVNAQHQDWDKKDLKFKTVGDVDGAIAALKKDEAQYFMWEHFTTKPLVDNRTFRLIADCPTPWPCFVIAVREEVLKYNHDRIRKMLDILNEKTRDFKEIPGIDKLLSKRYGQKLEDIRKWLEITSWSQRQITEEELEKMQNQLLELGLIKEKAEPSEIIYTLHS